MIIVSERREKTCFVQDAIPRQELFVDSPLGSLNSSDVLSALPFVEPDEWTRLRFVVGECHAVER